MLDDRERYREDIDTVACGECGEPHLRCSEALLEGMEMLAMSEAEARLSSEGVETHNMVSQAAEKLPGGIVEAWKLAEKENISRLPIHDHQVLRDFLARITMIERAREELHEHTFSRD